MTGPYRTSAKPDGDRVEPEWPEAITLETIIAASLEVARHSPSVKLVAVSMHPDDLATFCAELVRHYRMRQGAWPVLWRPIAIGHLVQCPAGEVELRANPALLPGTMFRHLSDGSLEYDSPGADGERIVTRVPAPITLGWLLPGVGR